TPLREEWHQARLTIYSNKTNTTIEGMVLWTSGVKSIEIKSFTKASQTSEFATTPQAISENPVRAEIRLESREIGQVDEAIQIGIQGHVVDRLARIAFDIRFRPKGAWNHGTLDRGTLERREVGQIDEHFRMTVANVG